MIEDTVTRTINLPEGTDWVWYPDLNVIGLSDRLDCDGRMRALDELQATWRRSHLRLVDTA